MAKTRAPKCPSISLEDAIQRVKKIYNIEVRGVFDDETAVRHMGYNGLNGASRQTLGACRAYGLIEGRAGDLAVSDNAVTIIADEGLPNQTDRNESLDNALKHNPVFRELANRFGKGGSDLSISAYLQKTYSFKPDAAEKVARNYIDSAAIALHETEGYDDPDDDGNDLEDVDIAIGDTVQWTSQGVDMFSPPKKVRAIDNSGEWLFVENEKTGVPMSEVTVIESVDSGGSPPTLDLPEVDSTPAKGTMKDIFSTTEGEFVIQWPEKMSADTYEDFTDWLKLQHRKIGRIVEAEDKPELDIEH